MTVHAVTVFSGVLSDRPHAATATVFYSIMVLVRTEFIEVWTLAYDRTVDLSSWTNF